MFEKWLQQLKQTTAKEKTLLLGSLLATIILTLWIVQAPKTENADQKEDFEMGLTIPKGFLMVPLELANGQALSHLVQKQAVIDLFQKGMKLPLAENLRIIKLNAGEGPVFGALVPDDKARFLQNLFSQPHFHAALKTLNAGPTRFHLSDTHQSSLTVISVEDN